MNYNTLKTDIANVVKTNGNEEITGALLQQCLLAMISNLGQYYQYGGILLPSDTVTTGDVRMAFLAGPGTYSNIGDFTIESGKIGVFTYDTAWHLRTIDLLGGDIKFCGIARPDTNPVYDDRDLCFFASEAGTYTDFDGIQVGIGEIAYLFYNNAEGEWLKETLFDLKDYIEQQPGTSQTKTMSQKAISDAISAIAQFMNAGWYFGGVVFGDSEPAAPGMNEPKKVFYIAVGPGAMYLEPALELADGELGIMLYDWEQQAMVDYQRIELYATQGMLTSAVNQLTEKIAEEAAKKVSLNSVEQSLVAGSAMSLSGKSAIVEFLNRIVAARNLVGRGAAVIKSIHGKTLAWNQLVEVASGENDSPDTRDNTNSPIIISSENTVFYSEAVTAPKRISVVVSIPSSIVDFAVRRNGQQNDFYMIPYSANLQTKIAGHKIYFATNITAVDYTTVGGYKWKDTQLIDLTRLYGSEIDGMTDAQILAKFESEYPGFHAYNPGALLSNDAESLETVGFNKWDEEWEVGRINLETGENYDYAYSQIRTKNYIPILPNTEYYKKTPAPGFYWNLYYDANKNYVGYSGAEGLFTTPSNAYYLRTYCEPGYGTTYNHDICINLSDPNRNGQYEPYKKSVCPLNIKTRTGKLNGQGASVVVFPDGMNGVGTSFDEANRTKGTKRMARVNLGDLTWEYFSGGGAMVASLPNGQKNDNPVVCSRYLGVSFNDRDFDVDKTCWVDRVDQNIVVVDKSYTDATAFKAAMDGVYLDYELADPQEYVWDEPVVNAYAVEYLGTESVIPGNTTDPASAPFVAEISYPIDTERGLVSIGTLDNLLSSLVSSGVIPGYSLQFNDNTGDYDVIIG